MTVDQKSSTTYLLWERKEDNCKLVFQTPSETHNNMVTTKNNDNDNDKGMYSSLQIQLQVSNIYQIT